jgi:hypothetical protein
MKFVSALAVTVALLVAASGSQVVSGSRTKAGRNDVSTNEFIPKGGIGIVNTHLYIALKSDKNELLLDGGKSWAGKSRDKQEVVVFIKNEVLQKDDMPRGFDLSKAIIVSFEGDVVRFFDFSEMSGGYYRRPRQ